MIVIKDGCIASVTLEHCVETLIVAMSGRPEKVQIFMLEGELKVRRADDEGDFNAKAFMAMLEGDRCTH